MGNTLAMFILAAITLSGVNQAEADEALAVGPKHWEAHNNMALASIDIGELEMAEAHFRAVLEIDPSTQAYTGLGIVLWQQGQADGAIASLQNASKADPGNAAAYDQLGTIQVQQGKLEKSVPTYRSLIRNQPSAAAHQELEMAKALERSRGASQ